MIKFVKIKNKDIPIMLITPAVVNENIWKDRINADFIRYANAI